jgi:hypothetical protein
MSEGQEDVYTGIDASRDSGKNYKDIPKNGIMSLKLIHNYVTEFLMCNQCEAVI